MGCLMRAGLIIAGFSAALAIAGCTIDTVPMEPVNQQAQAAGGSPRLHFTRGMPWGVALINMPDGEVLPGEFRVDETSISSAGGNFHAFGNGPRTRLVCLGTISAGHGSAECRSQNGAVYRMTL
jgi:hypothetical protein